MQRSSDQIPNDSLSEVVNVKRHLAFDWIDIVPSSTANPSIICGKGDSGEYHQGMC